jgi:hypothetical protein
MISENFLYLAAAMLTGLAVGLTVDVSFVNAAEISNVDAELDACASSVSEEALDDCLAGIIEREAGLDPEAARSAVTSVIPE